MYTLLDDLEFQAIYRPLLDKTGAWRQFLWWEPEDLAAIQAAIPENRVWTMADANGECVLMSEWHFVNRLHYVITEVPYDPVGQIEVMDLD